MVGAGEGREEYRREEVGELDTQCDSEQIIGDSEELLDRICSKEKAMAQRWAGIHECGPAQARWWYDDDQ